jgi:hypothetical protein
MALAEERKGVNPNMAFARKGFLALAVAGLLGTTGLASSPARADSPTSIGEKVKRTVKESAKTGGYTARDGALTFGRATRDLFTKGPAAAKQTWKANAAKTKASAKSGGRAVKSAAKGN